MSSRNRFPWERRSTPSSITTPPISTPMFDDGSNVTRDGRSISRRHPLPGSMRSRASSRPLPSGGSGVKDFDVFSASARALNFVATSQRAHSHLRGPTALEQGTPVVTYSPALLADSITLTIEIAVARFPAPSLSSSAGRKAKTTRTASRPPDPVDRRMFGGPPLAGPSFLRSPAERPLQPAAAITRRHHHNCGN
jgi:hypothetical protein